MIDINKLVFEEDTGNYLEDHTVYYYSYPKECSDDIGKWFSGKMQVLKHVVSIAVALDVWNDGDMCVEVSPTVEDGDCLYDCEWYDYPEWDEDFINGLFSLANI